MIELIDDIVDNLTDNVSIQELEELCGEPVENHVSLNDMKIFLDLVYPEGIPKDLKQLLL